MARRPAASEQAGWQVWVDSTQRPARLGCRKAVVDAMFLRRQSMKAKSELLA